MKYQRCANFIIRKCDRMNKLKDFFDNVTDKKLVADMLVTTAQHRDVENKQLNDIRYIVNCDNINVYNIKSCDNTVIIEIYSDYISKSDNERYTASIYFRVTKTTLCSTQVSQLEYNEIDFMCMLDEH